MKNRYLRNLLISPTPIFFIIVFFGANLVLSQCINSTAYATADAPSSGTVTISSCQYQTEYSNLNAVMAQTTYSCNYDLGGYITVRSGTYDGPIVKQGNSPLLWTAINSETHYIHWTTDANKKLIRKATLKLLDSKGEIISQKSVKIKKGLTKLKMNEKNIIPGVYYIKLINKNETIKTLEHIIQ